MSLEEIVKALVETPGVVKQGYEDGLQPSVKVVGSSLSKALSLFVTPVGRVAEITENNIHKYLDKLEGVPVENLQAPDTRVLIPIIEKLRYIEDEVVADYYTQILAMASQKDQANKVTLSFIEILNRVTADELKMLEYLNGRNIFQDNLSEAEKKKYSYDQNSFAVALSGETPIVELRSKGVSSGYRIMRKNYSIFDINSVVQVKENIELYFANLFSLGLIEKSNGSSYVSKFLYKHLDDSLDVSEKNDVTLSHGILYLTDLGKRLVETRQKKDD